MDFHKELHRIEAKEGLRGRKLQKALESFAWNITVLKVRGGRHRGHHHRHPSPPPSLTTPVPRTWAPAPGGCAWTQQFPSAPHGPVALGHKRGLEVARGDPVRPRPCPLMSSPPWQGQADLLKHAKAEALDNLWQIHNAGQSCGIGRNGSASPEASRLRAPPLEPIPEAEGGGDTASC